MELKTRCKKCGVKILQTTFDRNRGTCAPCYQNPLCIRIIRKVADYLLIILVAIIYLLAIPFVMIWAFFSSSANEDDEMTQWLVDRIYPKDIDAIVAGGSFQFSFPGMSEAPACLDCSGQLRSDWNGVRNQLRENDELWTYCSPGESWRKKRGRAGICVKRGNNIECSIVLYQN